MKRIKWQNWIPIVFAGILLLGLYIPLHPRAFIAPSLQGMNLAAFTLPTEQDNRFFSSKELLGQWSLLNVWATWCPPCEIEHGTLKQIAKFIPIYGISYRDEKNSVRAWLKKNGNPYRKTGLDEAGQVVVELGVMGTPETFLIDPEGRIRYRHMGVLTLENWRLEFLPILKKK